MFVRSAAALLVCLGLPACTFYLGQQSSRHAADSRVDAAAVTASADPALHERECSDLRADIGSSRYKERNAAPTTATPIIAEASEAKAQKKIDDLQQRYDAMGCVGPAKPLSPQNPAVSGPAADNPLAK